MSGIGPGDWIEYVGAEFDAYFRAGDVRQVVEIVENISGFSCGICKQVPTSGIRLAGVADFGSGACPNHWRPIYRPKSEFIESLMQPAPELEPA